jgi:hypothetical protein
MYFFESFRGMTARSAVWAGAYFTLLGVFAAFGRRLYKKMFSCELPRSVGYAVGGLFIVVGLALAISGLLALSAQ